MINFTRLTALSAISLIICSVDANAIKTVENFDMHKYAFKGNLSRQSRNSRAELTEVPVKEDAGAGLFRAPEAVEPTPALSLPASDMIGDIDGPDGKLWFYSANYVYDYIEHEMYTERIMREYEYKIYDSDLNFVGSIKDKVRYNEETGETRVAGSELAPVITKNFFNSDDKYEIVVGLSVNTCEEFDFVMHYYSVVYSLGGEKTDGYDNPVMKLDNIIGDVLDASTPEEERFFITFMEDDNEKVPDKDYDNPDPNDPDPMGYWAMLTSQGLKVETYAKADASGNLVKVWEKRLRLCDLPGDQQSSPFLISYVHDGKPYFAFSRYEDSFFNPYYDIMQESTQRENNDLIVEIYGIEDNNTVTLKQTANIPAKHNTELEGVLCSFYSIGSFRYRDDIRYPAGSDKADFIVTQQDYSKASDDEYITSFHTHNADGTYRNTLYQYAHSHSTMSDIPGFDSMEMFVAQNVVGDFVFHFVNLATGEEELSINSKYEIDEYLDPDQMTSNLDRVPVGDSYMFAAEMRNPSQDENGNDFMRIMWLDKEGNFDRIDEVPMGTGVYYATVLIESSVLDNKLFDDDDEYEYLVLLKRGYEQEKKKEEVIVGKALSEAYPEGKTLLYLTPDDVKGDLRNIAPYSYAYTDTPLFIISYYNEEENKSCEDFYKLPLVTGNTSVDMIPSFGDNASGIQFNGDTVFANGKISIFNAQGAKVAEATDSLRVSSLQSGLYIATCNGKSLKIMVK